MIWLILAAFIVAIDQATKYLVVSNIELGEKIVLIDKLFHLTYIENKGAAWGIFQNGRYVFIVLTILVSVIVAYFLFKSDNRLLKLALSFILGGGAGNLIDRVLRGSVVDFLGVYIGSYEFPKFNVADSFIVVGTIILAYYMIFVYKEGAESNNGTNNA
ncbi:MAG: signal peptidase II [Acetivibrionales bacterium]|jgi:signal peptidase II